MTVMVDAFPLGVPELRVYEGQGYVIGRASENDIVLTRCEVSRYHAEIEFDGLQTWIRDLGSRNGTRLNGEPLKGYGELRSGDVLQLGSRIAFRITLLDSCSVGGL